MICQLDRLSEWEKLESLTINKEDNPIYSVSIWRSYVLNRLSHLQLKRINNQAITFEDLNLANKFLTNISNLALGLPDHRLVAILGHNEYEFSLTHLANYDFPYF